MKPSRRTFLITGLGVASTLALSRHAFAGMSKLQESDPSAQAYGYKADAAKVDKSKFSRYAKGQDCTNCSLYQGKPSDAFATCPIFAGKLVAGKGWCKVYVRKT